MSLVSRGSFAIIKKWKTHTRINKLETKNIAFAGACLSCFRNAFNPWFLSSSPCWNTTKLITPAIVAHSQQYRTIVCISKLSSITKASETSSLSAPSPLPSPFIRIRLGRVYTEIDMKNRWMKRMRRRLRNCCCANVFHFSSNKRSMMPPSSMSRCSGLVPFRMMMSAAFQSVNEMSEYNLISWSATLLGGVEDIKFHVQSILL